MTDTLHLEPEQDDETQPAILTLEERLDRLDDEQQFEMRVLSALYDKLLKERSPVDNVEHRFLNLVRRL